MWEAWGQLVGKVVAESSWEGKRRECVDPDWGTGVSLVTVGLGTSFWKSLEHMLNIALV